MILGEYDVAVIGGSIRMGKINKKLKHYLKTHVNTLNKLHTALFLCCGYTENFDDYVSLNFPKGMVVENYDITTLLEKVAYFVKENDENNL